MNLTAKNKNNTPKALKQLPVSLIKNFLEGLGYKVSRKEKTPEIISNVFNTSFDKTALLSYIKQVFLSEESQNDRKHTNRYTTYIIAQTLSNLEYNVDVIDCGDDFIGDSSKYTLVIGLGKVLDYVLQMRQPNSKTKVIWFGTGCNPIFSNEITLRRIGDFYKRTNKLILNSSRYIKEDWPLQHEFADWIILHGADFAKSTYRKENITSINAPVFINKSIIRTDEEWTIAKQNYVWFGVNGAIHKGLDLVIESFAKTKNCNLHICGNLESEIDFLNHYQPIIDANHNITYHGFIDIDSELFERTLKNAAFIIYPSASEGNSPSVITCMANGGLIPIVSKNADINLEGFGISIKDLTVDSVINSIQQSQNLSVEKIKTQSKKIVEETHCINSFEYFKIDFKLKLQEALQSI